MWGFEKLKFVGIIVVYKYLETGYCFLEVSPTGSLVRLEWPVELLVEGFLLGFRVLATPSVFCKLLMMIIRVMIIRRRVIVIFGSAC